MWEPQRSPAWGLDPGVCRDTVVSCMAPRAPADKGRAAGEAAKDHGRVLWAPGHCPGERFLYAVGVAVWPRRALCVGRQCAYSNLVVPLLGGPLSLSHTPLPLRGLEAHCSLLLLLRGPRVLCVRVRTHRSRVRGPRHHPLCSSCKAGTDCGAGRGEGAGLIPHPTDGPWLPFSLFLTSAEVYYL